MNLLFDILDLHAGSAAAGADQRLTAQFWDFRTPCLMREQSGEHGIQTLNMMRY